MCFIKRGHVRITGKENRTCQVNITWYLQSQFSAMVLLMVFSSGLFYGECRPCSLSLFARVQNAVESHATAPTPMHTHRACQSLWHASAASLPPPTPHLQVGCAHSFQQPQPHAQLPLPLSHSGANHHICRYNSIKEITKVH